MGFLSWLDSGEVPYLEIVVACACCLWAINAWLDLRQLKALRLPSPPAVVASLYTPEGFRAQQAYQLDKWRFGFLHSAADTATTLAVLLCGVLPASWRAAGAAASAALGAPAGELTQTVAWVLLLGGASMASELPWDAYRVFVLEARHGFKTASMTWGTFALDQVKTVLLSLALVPPLVAGITAILQRTGPLAPLYLWAFLLAVTLVFMFIYPVAIAPLFNTYTPLPEGPLRSQIEALAGSLAFPLRKLYVVDGSARSAHSNAYMYGFGGNKRIVLYDTLLSQCGEEEVTAVLAHELGHWRLGHARVLLGVGQAVLLAQLGLFSAARASGGLPAAFGFGAERPAFVALVLFQFLVAPLSEVLGVLANVVSRRFEFQADGFAVGLGRGAPLKGALCTLNRENKSAPNVDALFSAYHYSHPPLAERLAAIEGAMKKAL